MYSHLFTQALLIDHAISPRKPDLVMLSSLEIYDTTLVFILF